MLLKRLQTLFSALEWEFLKHLVIRYLLNAIVHQLTGNFLDVAKTINLPLLC